MDDCKIFNDPIHGHIELHPLCVQVIDTPQFQRLRDIKQLGGVYAVFPGASHNRFEHSIGVSYLAGLLVEHLRDCHPELEITDKEILCIKLAGLCHDIGHGPYSHLFDRKFIKYLHPDSHWEHEQASSDMITHLIEQNDLWPKFAAYDLQDVDIHLIKEMIFGSQQSAPHQWQWKGVPPARQFLLQIVANKQNGIDVDKFDYFARDCHQLGMKWSFDAERLRKFSRIVAVDDTMQLCFHEKEVWNLYELFHTRYNLHKRAYQHRVARVVETMYVEALLAANEHLYVSGRDGRRLHLDEAIYDMHAYQQLTDSLIRQIEVSESPELDTARDIINRIRRRQLYPFVGEVLLPEDAVDAPDTEQLAVDLAETATQRNESNSSSAADHTRLIKSDDVITELVVIDYGMKHQNPVDFVHFYRRNKTDKSSYEAVSISRDRVSCFIPKVFREQYIRVYVRSDSIVEPVRAAFEEWCAAAASKQPMPTSPRKRQRPL